MKKFLLLLLIAASSNMVMGQNLTFEIKNDIWHKPSYDKLEGKTMEGYWSTYTQFYIDGEAVDRNREVYGEYRESDQVKLIIEGGKTYGHSHKTEEFGDILILYLVDYKKYYYMPDNYYLVDDLYEVGELYTATEIKGFDEILVVYGLDLLDDPKPTLYYEGRSNESHRKFTLKKLGENWYYAADEDGYLLEYPVVYKNTTFYMPKKMYGAWGYRMDEEHFIMVYEGDFGFNNSSGATKGWNNGDYEIETLEGNKYILKDTKGFPIGQWVEGTKLDSGSEVTESDNDSGPTNIGAYHLGGYVFYIDNTGKHGLVLSTYDEKTTWNGANSFCQNLTSGGYSDWYLPSRSEMELIYNNLYKSGIGGLYDDTYPLYGYWIDESTIKYSFQDSEFVLDWLEGNKNYVRAVRKF